MPSAPRSSKRFGKANIASAALPERLWFGAWAKRPAGRFVHGAWAISHRPDGAPSRRPGICECFFRTVKFRANIQGRPMPTISKGRPPVTLINIFTVTPEKQDELIELLTDVSDHNVRHHKGFISASLH